MTMDLSKYDVQQCPECNRECKTLYSPYWKHPGPPLCYWCNSRRIKREKESAVVGMGNE